MNNVTHAPAERKAPRTCERHALVFVGRLRPFRLGKLTMSKILAVIPSVICRIQAVSRSLVQAELGCQFRNICGRRAGGNALQEAAEGLAPRRMVLPGFAKRQLSNAI